ncbi:MAG: flavodoxin [Paludibacteraceae bacterium]
MKAKTIIAIAMSLCTAMAAGAKTLVVYYSYTNNVHTIVGELQKQIDVDVLRIEPADENVDYAANNYAIGSALISAIRNNPTSADSYPPIKPVTVNPEVYNTIIIGAPLWWSSMAAPLQTFLFHYGSQMAQKNIGLIVSSASSGVSGVVADAKRLIPEGYFLEPTLWIRSAQVSQSQSLIAQWLTDIHYSDIASALPAATQMLASWAYQDGRLQLTGDFDEVSIYDLSGRMLCRAQSEAKGLASPAQRSCTFALESGTYVVRTVKGKQENTSKICF